MSSTQSASVPWDELDRGIVHVVRAFASIPGIQTISSCEGHRERDDDKAEWHIGWRIGSADPGTPILRAGPHPMGWATTEWILWRAHALHLDGIRRDISVPPPYLNEPGSCLTFWVFGSLDRDAMNPLAYLADLKRNWEDLVYGDPGWLGDR